MGLVLETVLAAKQNITGGAFEALNPGTGDTFVIRDFRPGTRAYIEELWGTDSVTDALFSLRSARMNDTSRGLQLAVVGGSEEPQVLLPGPGRIPVYRADTLTVQVNGTANDDVAFAYLVRYEDLEGSDVNLLSWPEVEARLTKTFGILVQPTAGVANYGAPVALNSVDNRLEADQSYALLGAISDDPVTLIGITGPDTGRYRVGIPGKIAPVIGADWFPMLSEKYHTPSIPVIKANNAGNTLIDLATSNTAATPNVTLILGQLG